ncbi:hypothetical protein [uncultured Paludibaculum sp.]|uniref:hypothetical protein n=1 Tax=uncultured Paludibaculum sp. TaxID=1765020 RepID=UPI002AABD7FF|nr:hypothetical protein [uncultured Paludibaculum sp.]
MFSRRTFLSVVGTVCLVGGAGLWVWNRLKPAPAESRDPRVALLPFENQTGDAALDWPERLIPAVLSRQLATLPRVTNFADSHANEAVALGATHLVYGYITRSSNGLVVREFVEDARERKVIFQADLPLRQARWVDLMTGLSATAAKALAAGGPIAEIEIHNDEAARGLAAAMNASTSQDAVAGYEAAVSADPRCGWCWEGLAEGVSKGGTPEDVLKVVARSRAQGISNLSRARLDLAQAMLTRNLQERANALERITRVLPNDQASLLQLSQVNVALKRYDQAEAAGHRSVQAAPRRAELWNNYAYNLAYLGRYREATAAVAQYARLDGASANPLDSAGEIALMAGQFEEAARSFRASYEKDKNYNGGAALEKAALAHWLNGDKQAAKATLQRYFEDREKQNDAWLELSKARWEYLFGQTVQARNRMKAFAEQKGHPVAPFAAAILALHALADGDRAGAEEAARIARGTATNAAQRVYAAVATMALDPDTKIVEISDEGLKTEARALGLTARGEWKLAAAEWRSLLSSQPGGTETPYRELLALCLAQSGQASEAAKLVNGWWPLLTREQQLLYDFLIYPNLFYTRAEVSMAAKKPAEAQRDYDRFLNYAGDRGDRFGQIARARSAARL